MANQLIEELRSVIKNTWDDITPVKRLGSGAYGVVFKCEKKAAGTSFVTYEAIKVIKIPRDFEDDYNEDSGLSPQDYYTMLKDSAINEIAVMDSLKSPHVVHINEYKVVPQTNQFGWYILIKMDLLQNLKDTMKIHANDPKQVVEANAIKLCRDMCDALDVCFAREYVHRDIKPENIFVSDKGEYYLGDFGLAKKLDEHARNVSSRGTETYVAPEAYTEGCTKLTDLYSLGLVLYKMVNNNCDLFQKPGDNAISKDDAQRIRLAGKEPIMLPSNCSEEFGNIIRKMCAYKPEDRYQSVSEIRAALNNMLPKSTESKAEPNAEERVVDDKGVYSTVNSGVNFSNNTINVNHNVYAQANVTSIRDDHSLFGNKALLYGVIGVACAICLIGSSVFIISKIKNRMSSLSSNYKEEQVTIEPSNEDVLDNKPSDGQGFVSVLNTNNLTDKEDATESSKESNSDDCVDLLDQKIVEGAGSGISSGVQNSLGDLYDRALVLYGYTGSPYVTYYLGGQYERFTALFSCLENDNIGNSNYVIDVYGDDINNVLFHQAYRRSVAVTPIDVDVTGVEFMTIQVSGESEGDSKGAIISDAKLFIDTSSAKVPTIENDYKDGSLLSFKMVEKDGAGIKNDVEDSLGNKYDRALVLYGYTGSPYVSYYLGGEYERFTASFSCLENPNITNSDYVIDIYGDESSNVLFHQAFTRAVAVTPIDIDVTDVEFLIIQVSGESEGASKGAVISDSMLLAK